MPATAKRSLIRARIDLLGDEVQLAGQEIADDGLPRGRPVTRRVHQPAGDEPVRIDPEHDRGRGSGDGAHDQLNGRRVDDLGLGPKAW